MIFRRMKIQSNIVCVVAIISMEGKQENMFIGWTRAQVEDMIKAEYEVDDVETVVKMWRSIRWEELNQ